MPTFQMGDLAPKEKTKRPMREIVKDISEAFENAPVDPETGEMSSDVEAALSIKLNELADKVDSYSYFHAMLKSEKEGLEAEQAGWVKYFDEKIKHKQSLINKLKYFAMNALTLSGTKKMVGASGGSIYLSEREIVDITIDPSALPTQFTRVSVAADKIEIGKALKAGMKIGGCLLKKNVSVQIK